MSLRSSLSQRSAADATSCHLGGLLCHGDLFRTVAACAAESRHVLSSLRFRSNKCRQFRDIFRAHITACAAVAWQCAILEIFSWRLLWQHCRRRVLLLRCCSLLVFALWRHAIRKRSDDVHSKLVGDPCFESKMRMNCRVRTQCVTIWW